MPYSKYQLNICNQNLKFKFGTMIFCREVHVLDGAIIKCPHISKKNYEITGTAVILRRSFIFQDYTCTVTTKMAAIILYFLF